MHTDSSHSDLSRRRKKTDGKQVDCLDLPLVFRSKEKPATYKKKRNDGVILWSLFMSFVQIIFLLNEHTYNEVVATFYLLLAVAGLLLERFAENAKFPSSFMVAIPQVSLLFAVMSMIAGSRKINYPIDGIAWKFLFVSRAEKELVFGSLFDAEYLLVFLTPVYTRALEVSVMLAVIAMALLSVLEHRIVSCLKRSCRRSLFYFSVAAAFMLVGCLLQQRDESVIETGPTSCTDPPHVEFQWKPNIIILTIDSWRRDTVDNDSMPRTLQWLRDAKRGLSMLEWKNHDSCSLQSDQGYAALHYGIKGLKREKLRQFKENKEIKSWLLQAARSNGYQMHKVTPNNYDFCWLLMESCDLYTRDFDTLNGINSTQASYMSKESIWKSGGSKVVFNGMEELLKEQHRQKGRQPMVISADIQDLHHPLDYEIRPSINYSEPVITLRELHLTYSGGLEITKDNKADFVLKLRNRVKNALLNLDQDVAAWLDKVRPYLDDSILVLTGDHAELLFDGDENLIWHGVNNPIDMQRQVPMLMHGPKHVLSTLEVPEGIVTCHSDVLPSILEALAGRALGPRWKEELDYHSYYNRNGIAKPDLPKGFAYNSLHEFQVLIEGNWRLHMQNGAIKEARRLDDNQFITQEEVKTMVKTIRKIEDSTWPGLNKRDCQSVSTTSEMTTSHYS